MQDDLQPPRAEPPREPPEEEKPAPEERKGPTLNGVVRSVDGQSLTVRTKEVNRKYPVRPAARIRIDGKEARLSDLRPSYRVEVTLDADGEVLAVVANGPVVRCHLRAVDAGQRTLTVDWPAGESRRGPRTFPVTADAELFVAGKPALRLSADQKSVVEVASPSK